MAISCRRVNDKCDAPSVNLHPVVSLLPLSRYVSLSLRFLYCTGLAEGPEPGGWGEGEAVGGLACAAAD